MTSKRKITDIFPQKKNSLESTDNYVSINDKKTVNITFLDNHTSYHGETKRSQSKPIQSSYQSGAKDPNAGQLPWHVQSFLRQKVVIKDPE